MSLSNYPCGMRECDIPGIDDVIVSFDFTFLYTMFIEKDEEINIVVDAYFERHLDIDMDNITVNPDGSYDLWLTYSDDLSMDVRNHDDYDIENEIISYMNEQVQLVDCHFKRSDEGLNISYEVHR